MKKLYSALLALLLLASFPALAQKGLYFGIAGTVQSTLITNQNNYGLPEMDYKTTFGGAANLNVGFDFTNHLGIKIELGYGKYGQKYTDTRDSSTFDRNIKLNCLTIPIMLKYRTGGPIIKFYIAIGPQFNMLMAAKQTYNKNGFPYMEDVDDTITHSTFKVGQEEIKERFSSMDVLARMDLGLDITLVKHLMIEFGIKFGYGLMDLNATDYHIKDHSGAYHPSHNVFGGLTLGLNYRL
ncbi:MAG: porin family protein [Bacteroidales bacterium]